jgi:hypothetical protein
MAADDRNELEAHLRWFEENLAIPDRFVRTTSKGYYRRDSVALSWFKDDAAICIRNVWRVVRILERRRPLGGVDRETPVQAADVVAGSTAAEVAVRRTA